MRRLEMASVMGKRAIEGASIGALFPAGTFASALFWHMLPYIHDFGQFAAWSVGSGAAFGLAYGIGQVREVLKGPSESMKRAFLKPALATGVIAETTIASIIGKSIVEGNTPNPLLTLAVLGILGIAGSLYGVAYGLGRTRERRKIEIDKVIGEEDDKTFIL